MAVFARRTLNHLIYGDPNALARQAETHPLSEGLSYLLKYVKEISVENMLDIINTPGYSIMSAYFSLKLLDKEPLMQQELLSSLADAFAGGGGYPKAASVVREKFKPNGKVNQDLQLSKVSAEKLSRVAGWGPAVLMKERIMFWLRREKTNNYRLLLVMADCWHSRQQLTKLQ